MEKHQYKQIFKDLKQQILLGKYKTGDLLPSENELSNQYKLTRVTVRQALGELAKEGFIERKHGKGSIVRSETRVLGLLSFKGFSEVVKGSNHIVTTKILKDAHLSDWPENYFFPLSENELNHNCIYLERLRHVDEEPVMLEYTWIPNTFNIDRIIGQSLVDGSLFKTLSTNFQITITNVDQNVRAIIATEDIARLLKIKKKEPIIFIQRKYSTSQDGFFVYSLLYCYTGNYALSNQFN